VASFSGTVSEAGQLADMKDSLGNVMGGLGTAFDTTLLALCMAVVLIFPMKSMQKAEEDLLNWVDEYTNENLLKRLKDDGKQSGQATNPQQIQKAINDAMADHHAELRSWRKKLETIGETFRQKAEEEWTQIHRRLMEEHETREKSLSQAVEQCNQLQQQITELQQQEANQLASTHEQMAESVKTMQQTAESLQQYVGGLEQGLGSLNKVLSELDGKTVTIEKPRRGLFGRRSNNNT
jgi:methyl-accepting chemotaxis protein